MVLADDNFSTIVEAVRSGRTIYSNIEKFTSYLISRNFTEVILIFLGLMTLGFEFIPLLALQILFINSFDEEMPAIALGLEPTEKNVMKKKPRNPKKGFLHKKNALLITAMSGFMALMAFLVFLSYNPLMNLEKARTMTFAAILGMVVFNSFNFRSLDRSIIETGITKNKLLWVGAAVVFFPTIALIYVPFLQEIFELVPLSLIDWAIALGSAFSTMVFMEAIKLGTKKIE
jgi:Ca2+-transporting ATPase